MRLSITLFIFACISFFVDVATLYLYEHTATMLLIATYLYTITYIQSLPLFAFGCFLIYMHNIVAFGIAGIQLLYIIPLTIISMILSSIMYPNRIQLLGYVLIASIANSLLIESCIMHYTLPIGYTVQTIGDIMIGIILIYIIFWLSGLLGNRMRKA